MMPEAASLALQLIGNEECSISHFARVIERDATLSSGILSLANSPFYTPGRPVGNIREAVIRVGFRQSRNLIQASCANTLMQKLGKQQAHLNRVLLVHSTLTATLASDLSSMMGQDHQGKEFTCGILHDIGRLLLFTIEPEKYGSLDKLNFDESNWTPDREREVIGSDHCAVGCMFAVINKLPQSVCEAIRYHHCPSQATINPSLTATTAAADHLANYLILGTKEPYDVTSNIGLQQLMKVSPFDETLAECANALLEKIQGTESTTN